MSLKVRDIYNFLENLVPLNLADPNDVNGLQIGSWEASVSGILLAVNPIYSAFLEAQRENLNLIITHHPLFYKPINRIILEDYPGKIISFAIRQNLHLLSWHTPLDKISFGVSEALARELSFITEGFIYREGDNYGYGKVVIFENYVKLSDLAKMIKERLKTWVMVVGDPEVKIKKLGICGGAGAFLKNYLMEQGINTLLTSDVKYHQAIEAKEIGFHYLLIDHGVGEFFVLKILKEKLEEFLQAKGDTVKIKIYQEESPYMHI